MKFSERLFLMSVMLSASPESLGCGLVLLPIVFILGIALVVTFGAYGIVAGTGVVFLLKALDSARKRRAQQWPSEIIISATKNKDFPGMIALPQPPQRLLEAPRGPKKW